MWIKDYKRKKQNQKTNNDLKVSKTKTVKIVEIQVIVFFLNPPKVRDKKLNAIASIPRYSKQSCDFFSFFPSHEFNLTYARWFYLMGDEMDVSLSPHLCRSMSKCWMRMITRRWPSCQFTIHPLPRTRPPAWASCRSAPLITTSRPSNSSSPSAAAIQRDIFSSTPPPVSPKRTARVSHRRQNDTGLAAGSEWRRRL